MMRDYTIHTHMRFKALIIALLTILWAACSAPKTTQSLLDVKVIVEGRSIDLQVPPGISVETGLNQAGVTLNSLDRVEPPIYTLLTDDAQVKVTRIKEEYIVDQEVVPFEQNVLKTESLPDQTTLIAQKGENGLREITYRLLFEDGVEVSKTRINDSVIVKESVPEIIMVGIQAAYTTYGIPGRLAYLLGGNAWIMEETTARRRPVLATGDLDGRVFSLSPNGEWLLATRRSVKEDEINTLWVVKIGPDSNSDKLIDLKVSNIIHFAEWMPGSSKGEIGFSTVEPRQTAPGWQANNDFHIFSVSDSGWVSKWKTIVESNSGGVYGWWGTNYAWDPTGGKVVYFRPDGIGLINIDEGLQTPIVDILPYQTRSDWAWTPWVSWAPDGNTLYTIAHISQSGDQTDEASPIFDLAAIPLIQGDIIHLVPQSGMFAYPVVSPFLVSSNNRGGFRVAYLQANFPTQSETSRYRLYLMDRDGSNSTAIFPETGDAGIEPQQVAWSPGPMPDNGSYAIGLVYNGNLWLIDGVYNGEGTPVFRQITGDGLVNKISWAGR